MKFTAFRTAALATLSLGALTLGGNSAMAQAADPHAGHAMKADHAMKTDKAAAPLITRQALFGNPT